MVTLTRPRTLVKEISSEELHAWINDKKHFQLIDIREEYEVACYAIGGSHIPMSEILSKVEQLRTDVPVVIHCQRGNRSAAVAYAIESKFGRTNIYSLTGGVVGWSQLLGCSSDCL